MPYENCECCNDADILTVENLAKDAQYRGNTDIAKALRSVLSKCHRVQTNLSENDKTYIASIANLTDKGSPHMALLNDARRLIGNARQQPQRQTQPFRSREGIIAMLTAAFPEQPTEPKTEERLNFGFTAMLEAAAKKKTTSTVERQIIDPEITFPQICSEKCQFYRCCPYGNSRNDGQICVNRVQKNR